MKTCRDCKERVYAYHEYCPHCGADLFARTRRQAPKNLLDTIFRFDLTVR